MKLNLKIIILKTKNLYLIMELGICNLKDYLYMKKIYY